MTKMVTTNHNIFREAKELLDRKTSRNRTWDEFQFLSMATMPLTLLRACNDIPIATGLEELAKLVEEAK